MIAWNAFAHWVFTYIGPVSTLTGMTLTVPTFGTWWSVTLGRRRRLARMHSAERANPGERPAVLIVGLLPGRDIGPSVHGFLARNPVLATIAPERVEHVRWNDAIVPDHVAAVQDLVHRAVARLLLSGADTLHVFYAGPVATAGMLGAELANTRRVLMYQQQGGGYVCFGNLRRTH